MLIFVLSPGKAGLACNSDFRFSPRESLTTK
jgi:hypothetical protein